MRMVLRHTCRQISHINKSKSLKSKIRLSYHLGLGVCIVPLALSAIAHLVRPSDLAYGFAPLSPCPTSP